MTLNEMVLQEIAEWEMLSCQQKTAAETVSPDADNCRQFIHGEYAMAFTDRYPIFRQLQPQTTEPENQVEFAPLIAFYAKLAAEEQMVDRLIGEVTEAFSSQ